MPYRIEYQTSARGELGRLPRRVRHRVRIVVDALGTNPRPAAALWMWGEWEGHWRLRVGEYRIVYVIDDQRRRVIVVRVGHRSNVYQGGP